jgi:hypothetical protein
LALKPNGNAIHAISSLPVRVDCVCHIDQLFAVMSLRRGLHRVNATWPAAWPGIATMLATEHVRGFP